jgi:hypothetical protein
VRTYEKAFNPSDGIAFPFTKRADSGTPRMTTFATLALMLSGMATLRAIAAEYLGKSCERAMSGAGEAMMSDAACRLMSSGQLGSTISQGEDEAAYWQLLWVVKALTAQTRDPTREWQRTVPPHCPAWPRPRALARDPFHLFL